MSASRSKKVKVWVRTRPTGQFAYDNIDLKGDNKVTVGFHSSSLYEVTSLL